MSYLTKNTNNLKNIFDDFFMNPFFDGPSLRKFELLPSVDIVKIFDEENNQTGYNISIQTNGANRDFIDVYIKPGNLNVYPTLHIDINQDTKVDNSKNSTYVMKEINHHKIHRSIVLPEDIDYNNVSDMKEENGLLHFSIGLKPREKIPDRINIKYAQ